MRIIVPIQTYFIGGRERVVSELLPSLAKIVDSIILILPDSKMDYCKSIIPPSDKIIYESFTDASLFHKYVNLLINGIGVLKKILRHGGLAAYMSTNRGSSIYEGGVNFKRSIGINARINYLIKKHKATHCLYMYIHSMERMPYLNIPSAFILLDMRDIFKNRLNFNSAPDDKIKDWLERTALILSISQNTRREFIKLLPKYQNKIVAVPCGIRIHPQSNLEVQVKSEDTSAVKIFYYPAMGTIKDKNHITLFKAALKVAKKGFKFRIVMTGEGTDGLVDDSVEGRGKTGLEAELFFRENKILKDYIKGLGYCEQKRIDSIYKESSCVVLPSLYEGFGLPLAEALSYGVAVICSDIEVFHEVVSMYKCDDMVSFFPAEDENALAQYLEDFILHPKQRLLPEEVSKRFSCWTWDDTAKAYVKLLHELPFAG